MDATAQHNGASMSGIKQANMMPAMVRDGQNGLNGTRSAMPIIVIICLGIVSSWACIENILMVIRRLGTIREGT